MPRRRPRLTELLAGFLTAILTLTAIFTLAACTQTGGGDATFSKAAPGGTLTPVRWTGNQARYGGNITHVAGLTYQPDVVVIQNGADAVRSVSADGLAWTMDRSAPGVGDLRVGEIMLATALGAGRILAMSPAGDLVQVVLGPVALTDVIRDGHFASTVPIPLTGGLYYAQTAASATSVGVPGPTTSSTHAQRFVQLAAITSNAPTLPPPSTSPPQSQQGAFTIFPICCDGGLGVHVGYDNGIGRLSATVQLQVSTPTVSFDISIGAGHLLKASIALHGAAGLSYHLQGATTNAGGNVKSGSIWVPGSLTIPLGGPFSLSLSQAFRLTMQLGGAGAIKADGDYKLTGDLGFGFSGATPQANAVVVADAASLVRNVAAPSIGISTIAMGWSLRATVGIGTPGLSFGIWYALQPGLAMAVDNTPMSLSFGCATAGINIAGQYGVGYHIPEFLASGISAVLSLFGAKPIPATGGPSWGPYTVFNPPRAKYCLPH